ncbi:MAG TPA: hypothetical protein VG435_05855 [Acidimicrobiales bacterium]|jgi:hypothetical protein|nr:hypothetical protein [Acidimicrobiales bacterium]
MVMTAETTKLVMSISESGDDVVLEFTWATDGADDGDRVTVSFAVETASADYPGAVLPVANLDVAASDGTVAVTIPQDPGGERRHLEDEQVSDEWVVRVVVGAEGQTYGQALIKWSYERSGPERLDNCTIVDLGGVEHQMASLVTDNAYDVEGEEIEADVEPLDEVADLSEMVKSIDLGAKTSIFGRKSTEVVEEEEEDEGDGALTGQVDGDEDIEDGDIEGESTEDDEGDDLAGLLELSEIKNDVLENALAKLNQMQVTDDLEQIIHELENLDLKPQSEDGTATDEEIEEMIRLLEAFDPGAESKLEELEEILPDLPLKKIDRMVEVLDLEPLSLSDTEVKNVLTALTQLKQMDDKTDKVGRSLLQTSMKLKADDLESLRVMAQGLDFDSLDIEEEEEEGSGEVTELGEINNEALEEALNVLREMQVSADLDDLLLELKGFELPERESEEGFQLNDQDLDELLNQLASYDPGAESEMKELEDELGDLPLQHVDKVVQTLDLDSLRLDDSEVKDLLSALGGLKKKDEKTNKVGRKLLQASMKLSTDDLSSLRDLVKDLDLGALGLESEEAEAEDDDDGLDDLRAGAQQVDKAAVDRTVAMTCQDWDGIADQIAKDNYRKINALKNGQGLSITVCRQYILVGDDWGDSYTTSFSENLRGDGGDWPVKKGTVEKGVIVVEKSSGVFDKGKLLFTGITSSANRDAVKAHMAKNSKKECVFS